MKNKILFSIFAIISLVNIGFSAYLFKQNKDLQSDISNISYQLLRLDFDALENIKSKESSEGSSDDCGTTWMNPC